MPLDVRLLGPTQFSWNGVPVQLERPLERAFAARLALARGAAVADDVLVRDLWGAAEQSRPAERLRVLASRLRGSLGAAAGTLRREAGGYALDAVAVDLVELERGWGASAAAPIPTAAEAAALLELWRGPALADLRAVPFAREEGERLDDVRLDLELARLSAVIETGGAVAAGAELERLAQQHPLHEALGRLLAVALYRAGRQADALDRLARLRRVLADELGVDPAPETAALELGILRHDPALLGERRAELPEPRLPFAAPGFVGRAGEVAALLDQLTTPGVITLVGPPGAGKTRLAVELAGATQTRGRPVVWVDLAPLREPDAVVPAVLAATDSEAGADDPVVRLATLLDGALLVIDNAEHVIDAVAGLLVPLTRRSSALSVLVTSQRPLLVTGEELHHVAPLTPDAAAALFCARSGIAREARVDLICAAVDHLPLGIELAAGLTRALTLDQVAKRIGDRMRLLVGGSRDGGTRHTSLRAALDWSFALLDPVPQAVLRRMAVFAGGCTLEAAEQVVAGDPVDAADVAPMLAGLADRSLVTVADGPRFVLLESVRAYAAERLAEAGEGAAVRERHLAWCRAHVAAHDVMGEDEAAALDGIYGEWPNLLSALEDAPRTERAADALRLAVELDDAWMYRCLWNQARRHYAALVDAPGATPGDRARALSNYGFANAVVGETTEAAELLERASHEAERAGEPELQMRVLYHRGVALVQGGRPVAAAEPLLQAELIAEQLGRPRSVAAIRDVRATAMLYAGDAKGATALHVASNEIDRASGHDHGLVRGLVNEASARLADGDLDGALACVDEGTELARRLQDVVAAATFDEHRGGVSVARGDLPAAVEHFRAGLAALPAGESNAQVCRLDLADALLQLGLDDDAAAQVEEVLRDTPDRGVTWLLAQPTLAALAYAAGDEGRAAGLVAAARQEYDERGFHWAIAEQRLAQAARRPATPKAAGGRPV